MSLNVSRHHWCVLWRCSTPRTRQSKQQQKKKQNEWRARVGSRRSELPYTYILHRPCDPSEKKKFQLISILFLLIIIGSVDSFIFGPPLPFIHSLYAVCFKSLCAHTSSTRCRWLMVMYDCQQVITFIPFGIILRFGRTIVGAPSPCRDDVVHSNEKPNHKTNSPSNTNRETPKSPVRPTSQPASLLATQTHRNTPLHHN